jgi:carboxypeptidase Q
MLAPLAALALTAAVPFAQGSSETIDSGLNARIRAEETSNSRVMWIEHVLTDVYGPRPTGSPNHEKAAKWAIGQMTNWGLKNAHLEPWEWGHEGWLNEKAYGYVTAPVHDFLTFEVVPWSPSTNGVVSGQVVQFVTPHGPEIPPASGGAPGRGATAPVYAQPTAAELDAYLTQMAPKVRGGIVLMGLAQTPPFVEVEPAKRRDDDAVRAQYQAGAPAPARGAAPAAAPDPTRLTAQEVNRRINQFLLDQHVALRLNDAGRQHGIVVAQNPPAYDSTQQVPSVILRNEDFGRLARIAEDGQPVSVEFSIVNHTYPEGKTSYDAIAEIPGTDKANEVVMLGGHLDSWTGATGATDNAIGCAIMIEAARILQAIGAKPRRTIRVALWSGEEEGLLGSLAYVKEHFGSAEAPKPEFATLDAYWNIDGGTGEVRGASIFGPPESARIMAQFLKPWEDFKVYGAGSTNSRATGGTDSTSFNNAGLPGIGGSQDPIEYGSHTHHTSLDNYERILPEDVMHDAMITASVVYHIANRDQMMPRFPKDQMPPRPGGRGGQ